MRDRAPERALPLPVGFAAAFFAVELFAPALDVALFDAVLFDVALLGCDLAAGPTFDEEVDEESVLCAASSETNNSPAIAPATARDRNHAGINWGRRFIDSL
jgi:hypothetical protein